MATKLKLSVNTEKYQREERQSYGTAREQIRDFVKDNKIKGAVMVPITKANVFRRDRRLAFIIKEQDPKKPENELINSETFYCSSKVSELVRNGEIPVTSLLDFTIYEHTSNQTGITMPVIMMPDLNDSVTDEMVAKYQLTGNEQAKSFQRTSDLQSIAEIMKHMHM